MNWAPRVGVTYQLDEKTVVRAGYGRSYDIGVFGSLFGHARDAEPAGALGAGDQRAEQLRSGVQPRARAAGAGLPGTSRATATFPLPNGVFARALPDKQRPPAVDAYNVTVQRQLTTDSSIEVGYVGNRGAHACSSATARRST